MDKFQVLKKVFGHDAFREGQEVLIEELLSGHDVLGVMPTGAGKSMCYQIPALLLPGVTLIISPLISLMKDQVAALKTAGVPAAYINSSLTAGQQAEAIRRASLGAYKLIYVAPERLSTPSFLAFAKRAEISLVAVDEAHCVSQWGQDFRPSYLDIAQFVSALPSRPPVAAFTATATHRVRNDIIRYLALEEPLCVTTGFNRPNLHFTNLKPTNKMAMLFSLLEELEDQPGIIYCSTRKNVGLVYSRLHANGISAVRYHAGLTDEERRENQDAFREDRARIMVATNAFGMGIDKSNVRFVIHYNMPMNLENYYQEAGRAGRDGKNAECILLYSGEDYHTQKWMIEHREENPDLSPSQREEILQNDLDRLKQMVFYATSKSCLRRFILRYFGEYMEEENCGFCSVCENRAFEVDNGRGKRLSGCSVREAKREEHALAKERDRRLRLTLSDGFTSWERALYENLQSLRKLISSNEKVPPYFIFSDLSLEQMVRFHPTDREAFLNVSGVGETKCDRYGKAFLSVIRDGREPNSAFEDYLYDRNHSQETSSVKNASDQRFRRLCVIRALVANGVSAEPGRLLSDSALRRIADRMPESVSRLMTVPGVSSKVSAPFASLILETLHSSRTPNELYEEYLKTAPKGTPGLAYEPKGRGTLWSTSEDDALREEAASGLKLREIAKRHARTVGAVSSRLKNLEARKEE